MTSTSPTAPEQGGTAANVLALAAKAGLVLSELSTLIAVMAEMLREEASDAADEPV